MSHQFRSILIAILVMVTLLVTCVPASAGESAIFRGKVVDFDGKGIKKASVVLTSADDPLIRIEAKSDKNGLFEISVKDASLAYEAQFAKKGYVGMTASIELSADSMNQHSFTMLTQEEIDEGKAEILEERDNPAKFAAVNLYNDGVTAFTAGDLVTARERFEAALEQDESMLQALSALCLITMQQREWDDTIEYAGRTLAIEPTNLPALVASYRANKIAGNDAEAAAAAQALKSTGKNDEVAGQIFNEGVDYYRQNKTKSAIVLFEQAAELDPNLAKAHEAVAGLYLNQGALDKALAASNRTLALVPDNEMALRIRFEACFRSDCDQLSEAIESLGAVDLPYVSKAVNERAFDLFKSNQFDQAKKLVEQLLVLDPEDARANYVMGLILVNAGDNEDALKYLQAFVDAAPDDPDAEGARSMMEAIQ